MLTNFTITCKKLSQNPIPLSKALENRERRETTGIEQKCGRRRLPEVSKKKKIGAFLLPPLAQLRRPHSTPLQASLLAPPYSFPQYIYRHPHPYLPHQLKRSARCETSISEKVVLFFFERSVRKEKIWEEWRPPGR
jgi:hypothetical protein